MASTIASVETLAKEHAEELAALSDVLGNLKAIFDDALVHMTDHENTKRDVDRLIQDAQTKDAKIQSLHAALLASDEKNRHLVAELDEARVQCERTIAVEDENAQMRIEMDGLQRELDEANQRIAELQHMEARMRELADENAHLKTVSRFVTLQNENDKLRELLAKHTRSMTKA